MKTMQGAEIFPKNQIEPNALFKYIFNASARGTYKSKDCLKDLSLAVEWVQYDFNLLKNICFRLTFEIGTKTLD